MASALPPTWQVPEVFRERLGSRAGRQRYMVADGHLLLVLHAPPKPHDTDRVARFFWRAPDGTWASKDFGSGVNAISTHIDQYDELISRLDREENHAVTSDDYFRVLDQLAPLSRAARNMSHVFQEARRECPQIHELINLRDRAYEIEREAELLYNGAKTALDYSVAKRAEEQALASNRMAVAAHRLNILAAFFFPIAALSSLFGVNLPSGLEKMAPPTVFLTVLVVGLLLGGLLAAYVIRPEESRPAKR